MSSPFSKPSEFGGGAFFKPLERMNDLALLIEPTKVLKDQPNTYNGQTKNRDEVIARISIFKTQESLDNHTPSEILEDAKVVHGMLTSSLEKCVGGAMVAKVEKIQLPKTGGSGYVFRDVSAEAEKAVAVYYNEREAAVAAALAALGDDDFE